MYGLPRARILSFLEALAECSVFVYVYVYAYVVHVRTCQCSPFCTRGTIIIDDFGKHRSSSVCLSRLKA